MAPARNRPAKVQDLKERVLEHLDQGTYLDTVHSNQRKIQRRITLQDIEEVCRNGFHEKKKDSFDEHHGAWKYAMRGKTDCGDRTLRIILSFDHESHMLIITAIDLG